MIYIEKSYNHWSKIMFFAVFLQLIACSGNSEENAASTSKPSLEISKKVDSKSEDKKMETSVKPRPFPYYDHWAFMIKVFLKKNA